ncbi:MAG: RsmD family RNA methyltransferase [Sandaracinus sp.]
MTIREGVVRAITESGEGQIETAGGIVLATGVLPGERVRLGEIARGRVLRAQQVEVLVASPERVPAPCVLAARCGGCPLMHASAALSARIKLDRVRAALAPVIEGDAGLEITIDTPEARLGYRRRARLAFAGGRVGYRAEGSRDVVEVERCLVLDPKLSLALDAVRAHLAPALTGAGEIRLGVGPRGGTARIDTPDPQPAALYRALEVACREGALGGAALAAAGAAPVVVGIDAEATEDVEGRALVAPLGGFGQAHATHNGRLGAYALALAAPTGKRVLELYAGHGNFTLALAARAARVEAIELDAAGTACLRTNLSTHGLQASVRSADAAAAARAVPPGSVDLVFLDPPREGAASTIGALRAIAPAEIVYVSCHPESLARDLAGLVRGGYRLRAARAFDMFPQTAHVEVVVALEREPSAKVASHPGIPGSARGRSVARGSTRR